MIRPAREYGGRRPEQAVKRLPMNTLGRDFVVGDIHGAYDLVWMAMKAVAFNPKADRLLSVGDLIDRSEGSHRVLEFLAQPYVHAVRGNHDDDFCSADPELLPFLGRANFNGMRWVCNTNPDKLVAISRSLTQLPYALEVETPRGLVGLVHADVPAGMPWARFTELLAAGDEKTTEHALRSRERSESGDECGVDGVGRVFVGHSIMEGGPRKLGNVFYVDTGAFLTLRETQPEDAQRGSLTIAGITCRTDYLVGRPVEEQAPTLRLCHEDGAELAASIPFSAPRQQRQRARS